MSTRGLIAIEAADRSCRSIYVHFDMYPSGAGVCLNAHYNTKERIEALFALGDLSGLGGGCLLGGICVSVPRRQVVCEYDIPSERVAAGRRGAQGAEQWLKSNGKSPNRC